MPPTVVSTIPAAKLALVNLITAALAAEYPSVEVHYGKQHQSKGDRVVIGDTNETSGDGRSWRALKSANPVSTVQEEYTLPIELYRIGRDDESMQDVVESAFAMFALIDSTLRVPANVTLGVPGVIVVQVQLPKHEEATTVSPSFGCVIHSALLVQARI